MCVCSRKLQLRLGLSENGIIVMENILTVSNLEAVLIRLNYSLTLAFFV